MKRLISLSSLNSPLTVVSAGDRRDVYANPANHAPDSLEADHAHYNQMFAYYSNTAFDEVAKWSRYRHNYNLYRHTRPIFNPVTRVIDFYADHIYPGLLSEKERTADGKQSAIPFDFDTPQEIRSAVAQAWQWSNWQTGQSLMVSYAAMTGVALIEVVDDFERGKVRFQVRFPSQVKFVRLDAYGNVKAYVLEYMTSDPRIDNGRFFTYAKEVQEDFIAYYKNGQPFDYGQGAVIENPYGFAPAVWVKHLDIGTPKGISAIRSSLAKIDEVNSIVSHTADHIHKQINSPRILWSKSTITPLFSDQSVDSSDFDARQDQLLLKGHEGGTTDTLVGNLDPQTIIPIVQEILAEIEKDYPEITMYEKLRDQNIVTAPGAARLMGDVERKMSRPAANYDLANVKLAQMAMAIGGWRVQKGDWGAKNRLTRQQQKFLPFDLTSYNKGELDFSIQRRSLIEPSSREIAEEFQVRANALASISDVLPVEEKLRKLGYREEEIPAIVEKLRQEQNEREAREERRFQREAKLKEKQKKDGEGNESNDQKESGEGTNG